MGFGGSSVKKCTLQVPELESNLSNVTIIVAIVDLLGQNLSKESMSASIKFPRIPAKLAKNPAAIIGRTDFVEDNAVTRYNSFVGVYNQLKPDGRLDMAKVVYEDLIATRNALVTGIANLCV
jgi:hypothetical protein